jgi:transketolase
MREQIAMREVFGQTLVDLAAEFPTLLVLDGDLANSTRAEIFANAVPDRFLEMGIAEQNMIGVAAGLATLGFIPWISTFAAFIAKRSLDQVRMVVAQTHLNVKLAGGYAGLLTGKTGKTHQSVEDVAVFRAMPGMTVLAPADGEECRQAMRAATLHDGPVYIRITREVSPIIFGPDYRFALGRAVPLRTGADLTIISTGVQTARALDAVDLLAAEGISATLLHVPTIKPFDEEAVLAAASRTGRVLTTEEHSIIGGLGGAVAELLSERHPMPVHRHGLQDTFGESGANDDLLEKYGLTAEHVAAAARTLRRRTTSTQ